MSRYRSASAASRWVVVASVVMVSCKSLTHMDRTAEQVHSAAPFHPPALFLSPFSSYLSAVPVHELRERACQHFGALVTGLVAELDVPLRTRSFVEAGICKSSRSARTVAHREHACTFSVAFHERSLVVARTHCGICHHLVWCRLTSLRVAETWRTVDFQWCRDLS